MSANAHAEAKAKFPLNSTLGRDEKAWAKRILYRLERGDKSLLPIQIQFAKEALGISTEAAS